MDTCRNAPDRLQQLQPGDRLLDLREVKRILPLSTSTIYARVRANEMPAPLRIGANRVAWRESAILGYVNSLITVESDALVVTP